MKILDPGYKCKVCGSQLYRTDGGGSKITLQCSSDEAMFWNFGRGTKEQSQSHKHFMDSLINIREDEWNELDKI